jgi:hypothetical protein
LLSRTSIGQLFPIPKLKARKIKSDFNKINKTSVTVFVIMIMNENQGVEKILTFE